MAFAARQPAATEENAGAASKAAGVAKSQSLLQQGSKRRAPLTDMSNIAARAPVSKDVAAKAADVVKPRPVSGRPATKELESTNVAPVSVANPGQTVASTVRPQAPLSNAGQASGPRTRAQTMALQRQQQGVGGQSMSALLQSRSEAAVRPLASHPTPLIAPPSPMPDIDSQHMNNPLAAPEYAADIYSYYRRVETKFKVAPNYMSIMQTDINDKMRAILIDWLVEVHLKFKLMPESLYLTVNLIDRFLEAKPVTRKNLQLVGVAAMLIASKYEEIWAPEVRDFVYISDKAYTREQILGMEKLMLNTLQFNLTLPTTHNFLARYMQAAGQSHNAQVLQLSTYLTELALVDATMLVHSYSLVSAAALFVSLRTYKIPDAYPHKLTRHSGYTCAEVLPCAQQLVRLMQRAPTHTLNAVFKKYSKEKFLSVATVAPMLELLSEVPGEV